MASYETIRLIVWLVGVPIIVFLVVRALRRLRDIRELDEQLREEEARNISNPYADMARMYEIQELLDRARGGGGKQKR